MPRAGRPPGDVVAVVLACGGGLDAAPLAGRPLIEHAIAQARSAPGVSRVLVAGADSAAAPGHEGIEVLADIGGQTGQAAESILSRVRAMPAMNRSAVLVLNAAAPLRRDDHVAEALRLLGRAKGRPVVSVCRLSQGARRRDGRACLDAVYRNNGALLAQGPGRATRMGGARQAVLVEMDEESSLVVRGEADLEAAEAVLLRRRRTQGLGALGRAGLVVFDFDGVFTDNRVLVMQDGTEGVLCNRGDGLGLGMLRDSGLPIVVLSKEQNPVVTARCRKLGLECIQGIDVKLPVLQRLAAERGAGRERTVYVGNDVNDLECLGWAGIPVAVGDAHPRARASARIVLGNGGGAGAVRELCDLILEARKTAKGGKRP